MVAGGDAVRIALRAGVGHRRLAGARDIARALGVLPDVAVGPARRAYSRAAASIAGRGRRTAVRRLEQLVVDGGVAGGVGRLDRRQPAWQSAAAAAAGRDAGGAVPAVAAAGVGRAAPVCRSKLRARVDAAGAVWFAVAAHCGRLHADSRGQQSRAAVGGFRLQFDAVPAGHGAGARKLRGQADQSWRLFVGAGAKPGRDGTGADYAELAVESAQRLHGHRARDVALPDEPGAAVRALGQGARRPRRA